MPASPDLLDAAPAGFLSFRDDGTVVLANAPLLELLDYSADEVVGQHVESLFGVAARIFYQTHLFPLVRMHGRAEEIYLELRSSQGDRVPVLLNARRVDLDDEPVTHCVLIRVRERKKYEDELLRAKKAAESAHAEAVAANDAKSHYLRSVSHEIRTPINALLGYADLLELNAGKPMGDEQLGYVGRVRQAGRHLLTLVNDILDLAKIESGSVEVEAVPGEVAAAADAALALVEPQARDRDIQLVRPDASDCGPYIGSHERVVQILVNVLSNGIKFTEAGGRVELDWRRVDPAATAAGQSRLAPGAGPWLAVRVTDTGAGIPAHRLEEVFEPFKQIAESGAGTKHGTGLGMTISRELARLMGGDLTVESEPGVGSAFTLWLPHEA